MEAVALAAGTAPAGAGDTRSRRRAGPRDRCSSPRPSLFIGARRRRAARAGAIYLSFTDAIGRLADAATGSASTTSATRWHDQIFRGALWQHVHLHARLAGDRRRLRRRLIAHCLVRDFRGRWILRFLVVLPWAAPVASRPIGWLWLLDSSQHRQLDAGRLHLATLVWSSAHHITTRGPPAMARHAERSRCRRSSSCRPGGSIPFAVVIFLAGHRLDPEGGRRRGRDRRRDRPEEVLVRAHPAAAADRARRRAVRDRLHGDGHDRVVYILTNGGPFNSTQVLTTWAFQTGINAGNTRRGRGDRALPAPAARARHRGDAVLRTTGAGDVTALAPAAVRVRRSSCRSRSSSRSRSTGRARHDVQDDLDLANVEHCPTSTTTSMALPLGLLELRDDRARAFLFEHTELPDVAAATRCFVGAGGRR